MENSEKLQLIKSHLNLPKDDTSEDLYLSLLWESAEETAQKIMRCSMPEKLPANLKIAILNHIAKMHENRGDCEHSTALPEESERTYNLYKKMDITC